MLRLATSPGHPGRANEDFVGALPHAVVLVDGAGITGAEHLCRHGTAWYAARLGAAVLAGLATGDEPLVAVLTAAIDDVTDLHRDTCTVTDPSSPCGTVAVLRVRDGRVDHLVLGDSVVVLDMADGSVVVVEDRREPELRAAVAGLPRDEAILRFRAQRNRPGGFFVAKDDGRVAHQACTGSHAAEAVRAVAVLSNGASRVVDRFGLLEWAQVPHAEPDEIIGLVREAEAASGTPADDATAACWRW